MRWEQIGRMGRILHGNGTSRGCRCCYGFSQHLEGIFANNGARVTRQQTTRNTTNGSFIHTDVFRMEALLQQDGTVSVQHHQSWDWRLWSHDRHQGLLAAVSAGGASVSRVWSRNGLIFLGLSADAHFPSRQSGLGVLTLASLCTMYLQTPGVSHPVLDQPVCFAFFGRQLKSTSFLSYSRCENAARL